MVQVDAHTGKQDCFIYVNDSTASVVDGKTGEYDRFIRELFGSTALYFNSAFCAQGSDKLNDLTTGQLKELFNEFLQLDKLVAWEKTAKEIRNVAAEKNQALGWKIGAISDQLAKHDTESATKLATLNAKLKALESERQTLTESAGSIDRKIIELEQQEKTNAVISEQAASIRARMVESTNEFAAWCVESRRPGR
jgi:hypothetical protein